MCAAALAPEAADLAALIERQRAAFLRDGAPDRAARLDTLKRLRGAILDNRAVINAAINADFGHRSPFETEIMETLVTLQAIDYLRRNLHRFMRPDRRRIALPYRSGRAYVQYQPKGVVGVMAPWNYPLSLAMIPLATALAAGNRAMIKPSELTPRFSETLAEILGHTFPEDQVATVLGGPDVGAAFSALPFDHLLFTGSTQVGRKVMKAASDNLVPLTLELGGKSPAVIAPGHVTARTVASIAYGKLANAGQTCIAPDYLLVHRKDVEGFVELFGDAVTRLYPDGPTGTDYASIINEGHFDRLSGLVEDARGKGARVVEVGLKPGAAASRSRTMSPVLIVDPPADAEVLAEEIFGPILPVHSYETIDQAIGIINAGPRPLALYYFGPEDGVCASVLARTTSGNVGINNTLMHFAQDDLPFGGIGASGMGAYHGIEGFRAMSHAKGVFVQRRWNVTASLRPPFRSVARAALRSMLGRTG